MPLYKVSLHRRMREHYDRPDGNPFLRPLPEPGVKHSMMVREWTFEARDAEQVRRLLDDARAMGVPAVFGFELRSIEEVKSR